MAKTIGEPKARGPVLHHQKFVDYEVPDIGNKVLKSQSIGLKILGPREA